MRIDKIHIQNFKGFEDVEFNLDPHFTVFIGENGTGKTSVLDALAVVLTSYFVGIDVAGSAGRTIRSNEVRVKTIDGDRRPQLPCIISAIGELNDQRIENGWWFEAEKLTDGGTAGTLGRMTIAPIAEKMVKENRSKGGVTFPVIAYHGTGRLWYEHSDDPPELKKQVEGIAMAYQNCLSPKSSSKAFLSWYKTYQYEVDKFEREEDKLQIKIFNECILSFIPGGLWDTMTFSYKDEDLIFSHAKGKPEEEQLLYSQLSDGYRNVIGMVADIGYRCIKLNPHLGENAIKETPGIVLIDELDLHLHPKWQKHIVRDLKKAFPKVQFVATTHSPFIVQSLESDELVNLDRVTEVNPQDLSLELVAEEIMDVQSAFSEENQELEKVGLDYFKLLEEAVKSGKKEEYKEKLEAYERAIDDPGLRAFFKSNRIAKNIL